MMSSTIFVLIFAAPAAAMLRGYGRARGKVQSDMRPEVVANLLSNVEKKWIQGNLMVLRNVSDEASAYGLMEASCLKVSSAILAGSEGEKDRVVEYMQDVCGEAASKDSPSMCLEFASGVEGAMTDDESFNRDSLDLKPFCKKFWEHSIAAAAQVEKQKLDAEEAKREEEKKQEEEEEKKAEEAKKEAEAAKAAEEKAQAEAEKAAEAKAKEEAAKPKEVASSAAQQNSTSAVETQAQNGTAPEAQADAKPVAVVPQANVTSALESAAAPANTSEPVAAAAPVEQSATETKEVKETKDANATQPVTPKVNSTGSSKSTQK